MTTDAQIEFEQDQQAKEIKMMESYIANCSCNPYDSFECMCSYYRGKLEQYNQIV